MSLTRSETMARVKSFNTGPELALRRRLWSLGLRYRKQVRIGRIRPDISFLGSRVAVFVDGCFWHGCPLHYSPPKTRPDFWSQKLRQNVDRDQNQTLTLEKQGWHVLRVWEHEIEEDIDAVCERVISTLKGDVFYLVRYRIRRVECATRGRRLWTVQDLRGRDSPIVLTSNRGQVRPNELRQLGHV